MDTYFLVTTGDSYVQNFNKYSKNSTTLTMVDRFEHAKIFTEDRAIDVVAMLKIRFGIISTVQSVKAEVFDRLRDYAVLRGEVPIEESEKEK